MNQLFDASSVFGNLTEENQDLFTNKKTQLIYNPGETIIKQGALATHVIFVNNGLARKYVQSGMQKQVNLRLIKSGDFIAFFTVFNGITYPYSAVALRETTVCMIDKETLKEVLLKNPQFALNMTTKTYQQEHRYIDIINNLSFKQMRGKLASALLYLSSDYFSHENVFEYLTRQEIADFASITIESAIKFIKEFEKDGLLKLDCKKIIVTNKYQLEKISRIG